MQYVRINGMVDVDDAINKGLIVVNEPEIHGARKNKFWFNDYTWMYKEVANGYDTYEEYAEVICAELARLLGINCADYDLATMNGKNGVITSSVVKSDEKIISGTELLKTVYDEYFVFKIYLYANFRELLNKYQISSLEEYKRLSEVAKKEFKSSLISLYNKTCLNTSLCITDVESIDIESLFAYCMDLEEVYSSDFIDINNGVLISNNLYDIWSTIEIYSKINGYTVDVESFMKQLIDMFVFDIITNQGDRHADNWSIIVDKESKTIRLAGLYDNSGALGLNRTKALININDFANKLKVETKPNKKSGILKQIGKTIEHSASGLKVENDDVRNRAKNNELITKFIFQSSEEFIARLKQCINLLNDENIEIVFNNIEKRTGFPIPEIVKNVAFEVLNYNIQKIQDAISMIVGENNEFRKI